MKITEDQKWNFKLDMWDERFCWFLVEEGEIQYSFKKKSEALLFKKSFMLQHMLLTDINNITHQTMLEPSEFRCWSEKIPKTVSIISL